MKIIDIIDEDFVNYKKPCMTIMMPFCTFKCDKECGKQVCQNSDLASAPKIDIPTKKIIQRYLNNPISESIVFQGLEPMDSFYQVINFVKKFREVSSDDIVIYTGYTKKEIQWYLTFFKDFDNIIIKYGRFIPDQKSHFDEVLGVNLASDNQYAERLVF
jgi:hypothetical protein